MPLDPELTFTANTTLITLGGALFAGLTAVAGASLLVPAISNRVLPKPRETHLSDFLPFESILPDGRTVILKNGHSSRYFVIGGIDQTFMSAGESLAAARLRKNFLDSIAELHVTARIFTTRRRISLDSIEGYRNDVAHSVAREWNRQFERSFETINVINLTARTEQKLDEAEQALLATLSAYDVHPMTQNGDANPAGLSLGRFLGSIASPACSPAPTGTGPNLSDVLAGDIVWFRPDGVIEFTSGSRKKYAVAVGIKKLGDEMSPIVAQELTSLPMEISICRFIEPMSKADAFIRLEQHGRLAASSSLNPGVRAQFEEAKAMVEGSDESRSALCAYCQTVFIYGDSIEEVIANETVVRNIVSSNGITPVREHGATQASWFLQFPTMDMMPRPYRLFTFNIAFDYVLDRPASGFDRSDWGPGPIAKFQTAANTVYKHQFHINDASAALGHGVVIAPTGSGKTVLMEFLSLMASRHGDLCHFFFDRYRGTAIYNLAMGGSYLSLNAEPLPWSKAGGMNPFDCEDSEENRAFLKLWIASISGCDDTESAREISDAIEIAFEELDRKERSLAAIHQAAFSPGSRIRNALEPWVSPTGYGPLFNCECDAIDIDDNWLTTFDMTKLLEDPKLGAATVHYLMHKIRNTMRRRGAPGFIFIDETEPLLHDPSFKRLFSIALQEFRKIRGVVISVFQRPEAIEAVGVSQLVRQQSGTYYLFQNPGARASDYQQFELSERELAFVLGQSGLAKRAKRSILVKRPLTQESVIIDVDLSRLGPLLKIFSSSANDVSLVSELYTKLEGQWIERYLHHDAP